MPIKLRKEWRFTKCSMKCLRHIMASIDGVLKDSHGRSKLNGKNCFQRRWSINVRTLFDDRRWSPVKELDRNLTPIYGRVYRQLVYRQTASVINRLHVATNIGLMDFRQKEGLYLKVERDFSIIGTSVQRVDGAEKVTGKARYTGDLVVPGMIEGKFLRSPYAHARILSIDTRQAEALLRMVAVITRKDWTDRSRYTDEDRR